MRESQPDLVIVDLSLGDDNGLDLVKEIKTRYPKIPSLVLSMFDEALYAERALSAGALGYVTKQQLDETVLAAIRRVLGGDVYISDALQRRLAEQYVAGRTLGTGSPMDTLSDRELQVFGLIGRGRTTRQIAGTMARSVKTIKSHLEHIKNKLGVASAAELAQRATHGSRPAAQGDRVAAIRRTHRLNACLGAQGMKRGLPVYCADSLQIRIANSNPTSSN